MSWVCELTGKSKHKGNKVSHSNIKTRKFSYANISTRKWFVPELARSVSVRLSAAGLKIVNARGGLARAILQEHDYKLSDHLIRLKRDIIARQKRGATQAKKPAAAPEAAAN